MRLEMHYYRLYPTWVHYLAGVITGSFVIEKIFAIPGLGSHFVTSITNRDYTVIMGITAFYSIILLSIYFPCRYCLRTD